MDVDLDLLCGVVRVNELCLANEWGFSAPKVGIEHGHPRGILDLSHMGVEDGTDFWTFADDFVEDVDLIVNRDA